MLEQANERLCNPISRTELERRWKAVRERMAEDAFDALIIQSANNAVGSAGYLRWLTGQSAYGSYPQTIIFPRDGLMTLVCHGAIGGDIKLDGSDVMLPGVGRKLTTAAFPAVSYNNGYDAELIAGAIKKEGYRKVGYISANTMYFGLGMRLMELLASVQFLDASDLVDPIKSIKSPEEIDLMWRGADMQDEIIKKVADRIQPGMKDFEVTAYGQYLGELMGSETGYFFASSAAPGTPASLRRRIEQNRTIQEDDVFLFQAENSGPGGMFVHIARYFVFGKAPQELVDSFGAVIELQDFTLKLLKPGASCKEIFAEFNQYLQSRGLPEYRRVHCHGQGYDVVERPLIRYDESMSLLAPLNIGLHPSIVTQRCVATICDNYLLNQNGVIERLHKTPQRIFEI